MTEDCGVVFLKNRAKELEAEVEQLAQDVRELRADRDKWKDMSRNWQKMSRKHEDRAKASHTRAEMLLGELAKAIDRMHALQHALDVATERERLRVNGREPANLGSKGPPDPSTRVPGV